MPFTGGLPAPATPPYHYPSPTSSPYSSTCWGGGRKVWRLPHTDCLPCPPLPAWPDLVRCLTATYLPCLLGWTTPTPFFFPPDGEGPLLPRRPPPACLPPAVGDYLVPCHHALPPTWNCWRRRGRGRGRGPARACCHGRRFVPSPLPCLLCWGSLYLCLSSPPPTHLTFCHYLPQHYSSSLPAWPSHAHS